MTNFTNRKSICKFLKNPQMLSFEYVSILPKQDYGSIFSKELQEERPFALFVIGCLLNLSGKAMLSEFSADISFRSSLSSAAFFMRPPDYEAAVVFYKDDYKFDGIKSGIWAEPKKCIRVLSKFKGGVITPDFAMNQDLPEPWKIFNVYRKQVFGFYFVKNGLKVCNNVRWGTEETWRYCFDGIDRGSMVAISTLGCLKDPVNRRRYTEGYENSVPGRHHRDA